MPFLIVALQLLFGIDIYRYIGTTFIAVNLAAGLAVIPLAVWFTRRFGARIERSVLMRRLADEIAGRSLREAQRSMKLLHEFEEA